MAAVIPNISKGRVNEFVRRVEAGDPANARLVCVLLQDTGLEAIATLNDYDDLGAILAAANTEVTVASYGRVYLSSADITDPTVDDGADEQTFDTGDLNNFGTLEAGESVGAVVWCYIPDGVTPGADSTAVPIHITVPAAPVALNGEVFWVRTPNGWWTAA